MARIWPFSLALVLGVPLPAVAQRPTTPDSTIRFLAPLVGRWRPGVPSAQTNRRPLADLVVHAYEWTVGGMTLRLREGYRGDAPGDAELDGLIYWNPATEKVEFVAVAGHNPGQGRTFFGEYLRLADGAIERTYTVTYRTLADTPGEELGGRTRRYRETYRMVTADSIEASLDWWRDGRWQPFGPGKFTVVRRSAG